MVPEGSKKASPEFGSVRAGEGFTVLANRQAIKTPAGHALTLPTQALADAIVAEWQAQGEKIKPETMPLMQLAATSIDIINAKRNMVVDSLAAYAESDLLCHFAEEPLALVEQQNKVWQPWLDWAATTYQARLNVGVGIMPVSQPQSSLERFHKALDAYDVFHLAGLQQAIGATGSVVLGLALVQDAATPQQLFEAAELDALFQMEKWGEDPVTVLRHKGLRSELTLCQKWFRLLKV